MADKLESYFKKHLSDETPSEEEWNMPSDDVWEKALPQIQKKKGPFFLNRNIMLVSVLILIVLAATLGIIFIPEMFSSDEQVNDGQEKVEAMSDIKEDATAEDITNERMTPSDEGTAGEDVTGTSDQPEEIQSDDHVQIAGQPIAAEPLVKENVTKPEPMVSQVKAVTGITENRPVPYPGIPIAGPCCRSMRPAALS